jgi:hypothetical protein
MIGDKYTLTTLGSLYGVACVNVFSYEETSATTDPFPTLALADSFIEDVLPSWMACCSSDFSIDCVEARVLGSGQAISQIRALSSGNVGLRDPDALPASRVVCVSLYSEVYTKRGRGRHYISGIQKEDEGDNAISNELFDLFIDFAQKLIDPINESNGGQWKPVIRSVAANAFYELVSRAVSPQVRQLRGRTPRLC